MLKTTSSRILVLAALLALPFTAKAVIVVDQPNTDSSIQINYFQPVGQSFTAVSNTLLGFEFNILTYNPSYPNVPLTLDILDGSGLGGTLLASSTFNLSSGFSGLAGSSFSLGLTSGQQYTARIISNGSPYWGLSTLSYDGYAGGQAFVGGGAFNPGVAEFKFRATFGDASVPEAGATIAMVGVAFMGLALIRRRL